jgi:hypothetical protein
MEQTNNEIFKTKIFYEFFLYSMKNKLKFEMDVVDNTSLTFDETDKLVYVIIPEKMENYDEKIIINGWKNIIKNIETNEKMDETLNYLENLIK